MSHVTDRLVSSLKAALQAHATAELGGLHFMSLSPRELQYFPPNSAVLVSILIISSHHKLGNFEVNYMKRKGGEITTSVHSIVILKCENLYNSSS